MASIRDISKYENLATNRALFFDGSDYVYQKTRTIVFLKCEAEEVRDAVEIGPCIPVKIVDGKEVLTSKAEWIAHDKKW